MKISTNLILQGSYLLDERSSTSEEVRTEINDPDALQEGSVSQIRTTQTLDSSLLARTLGTITSGDETVSVNQQHMVSQTEQQQNTTDIRTWGWRSAAPSSLETIDSEIIYTRFKQVTEHEQRMIFESVGEVKTEDGRDISFMMQLDFHNQFRQESEGESFISASEWVDPLVISLTGQVPQITDGSFEFDLNADGHKEVIGNLSSGIVYIAFDKNNDGIINDGTELFGATSGQGFAELAQYDSDGNGWIDENDAIFSKLSVWQPNQESSLSSFSQAGIGAIYLHSEETPYELTNISGNADARITSSSVALMESGVATSIFQLEWAQKPELRFSINGISISEATSNELESFRNASTASSNTFFESDSTSLNTGAQNNIRVSSTKQSQTYQASFMEQYNKSIVNHDKANKQSTSNVSNRVMSAYDSSKNVKTDENKINMGKDIQRGEDAKITSLRAVIDVLREMRNSNSAQQAYLNKLLKTGK